jgi:hypothetical protein
VYMVLNTWRIDEAIRAGDGVGRALQEAAPRIMPILHQHGLRAAYAVRTGPDELVTVNLYGSPEEVETAIGAAAATIREVLAGKLEFVARGEGAVLDLLALAGLAEQTG